MQSPLRFLDHRDYTHYKKIKYLRNVFNIYSPNLYQNGNNKRIKHINFHPVAFYIRTIVWKTMLTVL